LVDYCLISKHFDWLTTGWLHWALFCSKFYILGIFVEFSCLNVVSVVKIYLLELSTEDCALENQAHSIYQAVAAWPANPPPMPYRLGRGYGKGPTDSASVLYWHGLTSTTIDMRRLNWRVKKPGRTLILFQIWYIIVE